MKKILLCILGAFLGTTMVVSAATSVLQVFQGGTGANTISGILFGNGTSAVTPLTIGSGLSLVGSTLSATGVSGASSTNPLMATYFVATGTSATSTFAGGIKIGNSTARDNLLQIDCNRTYAASISVGGCVNITNTLNDNVALALYTNHGAGVTAPLLRGRVDNTAYDGEMVTLQSISATRTTLGVEGSSTAQGVIKISHHGGGISDANASSLSIDNAGNGTAAQGIFMTSTQGGTTGALMELRNNLLAFGGADAQVSLLTLKGDGKLGLASSTPSERLSVTGTTTIDGRLLHVGNGNCGTGGLYQFALQGIEYCGSDNTSTGGVQILEDNGSNGANAWGGFTLNNDLADNSFIHFGGLYLNSSTYSDSSFGTAFPIPNQLALQNTDGPLRLVTGTTTRNQSSLAQLYIAFNPGSSNATEEAGRITGTGLWGMGTTTPSWKLTIASSTGPQLALTDGTAASNAWTFRSVGNNLYIATSTVTATSSKSVFYITNNGTTTVEQLRIAGNSTTTIATGGAFQFGTTARDNQFFMNCNSRVFPASVTTGGCVNIDNGSVNSGPALEVQSSFGAGATGRGIVENQTASAFDQDWHLSSTSCTNCTNLNLKGTPTAKGILKVEHTGTGTGFSNSSGLSIDLVNCTDCQGIFIDRTGGVGTGALLQAKDGGNLRVLMTAAGQLSLATSTPFWQLTVASSTGPQIGLTDTTSASNAWVIRAKSNSLFIATSTATATSTVSALIIDPNGAVYLPGTTVSASAQTGYWCYDTSSQLVRVSTTCIVSALKFKKDVTNIDVGLQEIMKLRPVNYFLKDSMGDPNNTVQQFGFVAEEVAKVDDRLITKDSSGEIHGFRYEQFTAILTKAIQEIEAQIQTILARLDGNEKKLDELQKQVNVQQQEIDAIKTSLK